MESKEFLDLLTSFAFGQLDITHFSIKVDEKLRELREYPRMTTEKALLSKIQLYLHEAEEGFRSEFETYILVRSLLDRVHLLSGSENKSDYYPPDVPFYFRNSAEQSPATYEPKIEAPI
jgi:Ribonuclease G/E